MMKIALVTDAWYPQVNGVVRTLTRVIAELEAAGHRVETIHPGLYPTLPCPSYPEIRLAVTRPGAVGRRLAALDADAIHIATEGPLGFAARRYCVNNKIPFTTAYHTRFPEYLRARAPVPLALGYAFMRHFHGPSAGVMVATESLRKELAARGFRNLKPWSRGVDSELFRPRDFRVIDLPRPVFLSVGRIAVEKNLEAFLKLDLPGSKLVVGGGPQLEELQRRYPRVYFTGPKSGEALAELYCCGDVFVFPSRTDTFGLVMLEALASGLPVAAFPVPGPLDVVDGMGVGVLKEDLRAAALAALKLERPRCRAYALEFSWKRVAEQFMANLAPRHGLSAPLRLESAHEDEDELLDERETAQVAEA